MKAGDITHCFCTFTAPVRSEYTGLAIIDHVDHNALGTGAYVTWLGTRPSHNKRGYVLIKRLKLYCPGKEECQKT